MPYSEVSIVGYNSNPPEDDGTQASSNEVSWSKHKDKLGDPLKTAIESTQSNITTVVDAIEADLIEAGTAMLFMQTAAPTGWTKDTTANLDDTALRLTTGTVTPRTDQSAFSTVFGLTSTDNHTLTQAQSPAHDHSNGDLAAASHNHNYTDRGDSSNNSPGTDGPSVNVADNTSSSYNTGTSGSLNVTGSTSNTGSNNGHSHGIDLRVNYHDVILATKD